MNPNLPTTLFARARGSAARLLRTLAGVPAGLVSSRRRGSFLVMVVGVLALLAVIAILYAGIGNSDRQRTGAMVRKDRLNDYPNRVADYIAGIIGEGVFKNTYDDKAERDPLDLNSPLYTRAAATYPGVRWDARSDVATVNPNTPKFTPGGGAPLTSASLNIGSLPQSWTYAPDPWLASTEPAYLNFSGAALTQAERDRPYTTKRDWTSISNIAPDGRFVNLSNLRDAFNAPPGSGPGVGLDGVTYNGMSTGLKLIGPNNLSNTSAVATLDFGGNADRNVPAHWTNRQRGAFRPAGVYATSPGSVDNAFYQWADTDGDGFFDARLFEMTDYSTGSIVDVIPRDPRFRYFLAVRIVDLSALVNVNTATDFMGAPDRNNLVGASPADVDLRRLLTMRDFYDSYNLNNAPLGGYDGIYELPPPAPVSAANYALMGDKRAHPAGDFGYVALRMGLAAGLTPPRDRVTGAFLYAGAGLDNTPGLAGDYGITATPADRNLWEFGSSATASLRNPVGASARTAFYNARVLDSSAAGFSQVTAGSGPWTYDSRGVFAMADEIELLTRWSINTESATSNLERALGGRDNTGPGISTAYDSTQYSPLRDNRPEKLELTANTANVADFNAAMLLREVDLRHRMTTLSWSRSLRAARGANPDRLEDTDLRITVTGPSGPLALADKTTNNVGQATTYDHTGLNLLLQGYADALLPFSNMVIGGQQVCWHAPNNRTKYDTLAYGYRGPEFALHRAAHMALNLKDSFDVDGRPTAVTARFDSTAQTTELLAADGQTTVDGQMYPWSHVGRDLDLDAAFHGQNPPTPAAGQLRLDANGTGTVAPVVNMFGVEAQPFLTGVSVFTAYADAPLSAGGDTEAPGSEITIRPGIVDANSDFLFRVVAFQLTNPFGVPVTLNKVGGSIPGGVDMTLFDIGDAAYPALDRDDDYYYLTFGGRTFKLVSLTERLGWADGGRVSSDHAAGIPSKVSPDGDQTYAPLTGDGIDVTAAPITIQPGKTIVCYGLSQVPRQIIQGRLDRVANPPLGVNSKKPAVLTALLKTQLGQSNGTNEIAGVYWIPEFIPSQTGPTNPQAYDGKPGLAKFGDPLAANVPITPNTNFELFSGPLGVRAFGQAATSPLALAPAVPEAVLWRAMRAGDETLQENVPLPPTYWDAVVTPAATTATMLKHNFPGNDLMVDRLRIPTGSDMDVRIKGPGNVAWNSVAAVPVNGTDAQNDDTGFMILLGAAVRRPADPSVNAAGNGIPLGALPAYCLETKTAGWNHYDSVAGVDWHNLTRNDFDTVHGGATRVRTALTTLKTVGNEIVDKFCKSPTVRTNDPVGNNRVSNTPYTALYPEIYLDNAQFLNTAVGTPTSGQSRLRVTDLLLPLAIGPSQDPMQATQEAQWITLSEALAASLGYEDPSVATNASLTAALGPLYQQLIPHPLAASQPTRLALDRGNLALDDFAPFLDANANAIFDPGVGANTDTRYGTQIPMALAVLDQFNVRATGTGSLTQAEPGRINLNTAGLFTMRQLPMFSPPPDIDFNSVRWWWGQNIAGRASINGQKIDVAPTVVAYRDKAFAYLRPQSDVFTPAPYQTALTFTDELGNASMPPNSGESVLNGRSLNSQITAISEQPGFRSLGELMCARMMTSAHGLPPESAPFNIDYLGHALDNPVPGGQPAPSARLGVDLAEYADPSAGNQKKPSGIINGYAQKLSIAAGALGSATVRSDTFAVWFVVQGYQKSDTEGLGTNDPLVPSIQRRFLMIVDRSNVVRRGDKPRILLLKEVPM